jgi:hypothetical protein
MKCISPGPETPWGSTGDQRSGVNTLALLEGPLIVLMPANTVLKPRECDREGTPPAGWSHSPAGPS